MATVRTDFFLDDRNRLTEQERALMTAMLADLLGGAVDELRASLPPGLAAANDEDGQSLVRQLGAAGLLDRLDLIAILLRRADEERIASAVRARSHGSGSFLQALVADADEAVSGAAMALILARGRRRDRLGQPRLELDDLPGSIATPLVQAVAAALRDQSAAAGDTDAQLAAAAETLIQRRDPAKGLDRLTAALVESLAVGGQLEDSLLMAAGQDGDIDFLAHALAQRAGIDPQLAWDRLLVGDHGGFVMLLRIAGMARDAAAGLLAQLGDLVGIADLGAEIGRFEAITDEQAAAQQQWLKLDPDYRHALTALRSARG